MSDQEKFNPSTTPEGGYGTGEIEANINSLYEEMKTLSERIAKLEEEAVRKEPNHDIDPDEEDELYDEAVKIVKETGKASTSFIQRKLDIGYSRAARLIDIMEEEGIIGPAQGSKPREVFK